MSERSSAKSSAAKISPLRYGDALHISFKFVMASADSIKANIFKGFEEALGDEGCLSGSLCRRISVMKWRSEARFTFGTTIASRFGACRTEIRSSRARPEDTAFIRTESSLMLEGRGCERKERMLERAVGFWEGVTESSRS